MKFRKMKHLFAGWKARLLCKIIPNGDGELMDFNTNSAKDRKVKVGKLELLESFEDSRKLKELTADFLQERGWKPA